QRLLPHHHSPPQPEKLDSRKGESTRTSNRRCLRRFMRTDLLQNHKPLLCRLTAFKLPDSSYSGLESIVVGLSQAPDIGIVTKVWYAREPSPRVFHHSRTKLLRELSAKAFDIDIGSLESHEHD